MKKLHEEGRAQKKELRKESKELKEELREELMKPSSDRNRIDGIVGKMKELQGKEIYSRVDHFLAVKEILTEEQFQKFLDLHEKRHGKKHGKKGEKRGRKGPRREHR